MQLLKQNQQRQKVNILEVQQLQQLWDQVYILTKNNKIKIAKDSRQKISPTEVMYKHKMAYDMPWKRLIISHFTMYRKNKFKINIKGGEN